MSGQAEAIAVLPVKVAEGSQFYGGESVSLEKIGDRFADLVRDRQWAWKERYGMSSDHLPTTTLTELGVKFLYLESSLRDASGKRRAVWRHTTRHALRFSSAYAGTVLQTDSGRFVKSLLRIRPVDRGLSVFTLDLVRGELAIPERAIERVLRPTPEGESPAYKVMSFEDWRKAAAEGVRFADLSCLRAAAHLTTHTDWPVSDLRLPRQKRTRRPGVSVAIV